MLERKEGRRVGRWSVFAVGMGEEDSIYYN